MIITKLYTGYNNKSYFMDLDCGHESNQPLGAYSRQYPATGIIFRDFKAGLIFEMHPAPKVQYIVYLEGEVEVETSAGAKRIFKAGDVLLAADTTGLGHITRTLTAGKSIIIPTEYT